MLRLPLKKMILSVGGILFCTLHFTFGYSGASKSVESFHSDSPLTLSTNLLEGNYAALYDSLNLELKGLSQQAFEEAVKGFNYLKEHGKINNTDLITIADFSKPSTKKRLFIIDLVNSKILFNTYVAHGQNSGREFANELSNIPDSYQSSPGFYVTSSTYTGKNGFSMYLYGMEKGINDRAYDRAIVMHGAPYVSEDFVNSHGYLGRSWGCPAVPEHLSKQIISKIKNGTCLFIYSDKENYLKRSTILNS